MTSCLIWFAEIEIIPPSQSVRLLLLIPDSAARVLPGHRLIIVSYESTGSFCNEQGCGASPTDPVQQASISFRALTDELDGTRPTLGNMRSNDWGGLLTNETDVEGFSHSGRQGMDLFRARFPNKPLFESECCSCNTQRREHMPRSWLRRFDRS